MTHQLYDVTNTDERLFTQRRDILKMGMFGALAAAIPFVTTQSAFASSRNRNTPWKLTFRNAHTDESFSGVYRIGDKYLPQAFERINYVLRDFRTNEVFPMDPHVIDIIALIHHKMKTAEPYQILSGYRSPKTNAMLGKRSRAVASNSFHMYGQAIDIRIPDQSIKKMRNVAKSLQAGGVGYYPRSNFIHVDTGSVRTWTS